MGAYITRRLLQAIPVIFLITVISFALMMQAPGGPAAQFAGNPRVTPEEIEKWLARYCLEQNPDIVGWARIYGGWTGIWNCDGNSLLSDQGLPNFLPTFLGGGDNGLIHGDLGISTTTNRPVSDVILERVPATLVLMTTAFVIWVSIAIVLGVLAAVKRYSLFDQGVTLFSYVFYSLPTFWLGLILIYFFAVQLRWLPSQGIVDPRNAPAAFNTPQYWTGFWADSLPNIMDIGRHLVLPVITLVAVSVAADSRFVRSSMLDTLSQDYVRTARAKGLPRRRVIFHHAFRNAMLPILTTMSLQIAFLFSGAIVTETVFSWPGMGRLYIQGVTDRDYFLLMGILLFSSMLVVIMNIVADVLYAVADPKDPLLMTDEDRRLHQLAEAEAHARLRGAAADTGSADNEVALESLSQWQLAWRRFKRHKLAMVGAVIFLTIIAIAVIGPFLLQFEMMNFPGAARPGGDSPSVEHIFGTDRDGRDVFGMTVHGARTSIMVGLGSVLIAGFVGVTLGSTAGFLGGRVDNVLMRVVDVMFAIPFLFVILVAAQFFGQGDVFSIILIFGLLTWPLIARLVRAQFLSLREADFVDAATAVGVSKGRIAFRHVLPNAIGPVIVAMTLLMASNIILEAFVSFLNFGISETQPTWGNSLSNAQTALSLGNWWWALFPGIAIALTVIAINFIGDGLRDALDPRTRE